MNPETPFQERANELLDRAYRGKYHTREPIVISKNHWVVNNHVGTMGLSTYDHDILTRLVVAAHDLCLRVCIGPSGPGMVKVHIWERKNRDGDIFDRHPTMEEAVEKARKNLYH